MKTCLSLLALFFLAAGLTWANAPLVPGPVIGIGTEVRSGDNQPVVGHVLPNSPADKAGLKPGDRFVRIDGASVTHLSLLEIAGRLRGAVGSPVQVTVLRHGKERSFALHREILLLPGSALSQ